MVNPQTVKSLPKFTSPQMLSFTFSSRVPSPSSSSSSKKGLKDKLGHKQLVDALKRCTKTREFDVGRRLHADAVATGSHNNKFIATALVTMYSKCRSVALARRVFDEMVCKDVVSWNAIILGCLENGEISAAMDLFTSMNCEPNSLTFVAALKACGGLASEAKSEKQVWLEKGISIHEQASNRGFASDIVLATTLVDMYSKCGSMHRARDVFEKLTSKNVVTWTCLLSGYVENQQSFVAMELFDRMDCEPDSVTYVAVFKACGSLACERDSEKDAWLERGIRVHKQVRERGFDSDLAVANTLIDMYSKCGSVHRSREVFDAILRKDVVVWTCLILGYVDNGECLIALDLFRKMDCKPDRISFVAALRACGGLACEKEAEKNICLESGIAIHKQVRDLELDSDIVVANSLISMYGRCGEMQRAKEVFDGQIKKDVVSWNSLIVGYVENGENSMAMETFTASMIDCEPNSVTYVAALAACGSLVSVEAGRRIHSRVCRLGTEQDQVIANSLMDFYAKCGSVIRVEEIFNGMNSPDVVSWNTLMAGHGSLGDSARIFDLAKAMGEAGVGMDGITFTCVLSACNHSGCVEEGRKFFERMLACGIAPSVEHYNCVVDLLGRSNRVREALAMVERLGVLEANVVTWTSLLGASNKWGDLEVGKVAFDALLACGTEAAAYVLIHGNVSMWRELQRLDGVSSSEKLNNKVN